MSMDRSRKGLKGAASPRFAAQESGHGLDGTRSVAMMATVAASQDPTVDTNVIQALRDSYDELTRSQKRIAEAIVEDPEFVAFATVDKMASRLGVSPSTVVRFTYRLGLTGYQDLQERVRTLVRSQMRSSAAAADEHGVVAHLAETAYASSLEHDLSNLRQTAAGLERAQLDRAVDLLADARRVIVVADGTAASVAAYMTLALGRTRGQADLVQGGIDTLGRLVDIDPADTVIAITFPPYASTVLRAARWAKHQKASLIALTDSPVSPVGQIADIGLPIRVSGIGPHNTMVATMAVTNALLNQLYLRNQDQAIERYATITSLMDQWDLGVLKSDND
jgi:DNA-binding MurR/RpiR family transcriptional regulator